MAVSRAIRDALSFGAVLALLVAVSLLPQDTSLSEVERAGTLRVCVPPSYPPLVTGDPERPGLDVELLRAVADRLGVSLALSENVAMGRDFNPRNWDLNRAQCQVIAGGVVDSQQTRSFLETGPSYAQTGWAVVSPSPIDSLSGKTVGVLALVSGLDRIGLSSFLRGEGVTVRVVTSAAALVEGLASGAFDAGVTESMLASSLATDNGWSVDWLPPQLARYNVVFGLWKGDITLKTAIDRALAGLAADGTVAALLDLYGIHAID